MANSPILALGIENSSSLAWSAPQRFQKDLAKLSRADQHHLYLVVIGPKLVPTALDASSRTSEWKLDITYGTPNGLEPYTIMVPEAAFPGSTLSFDPTKQVLTLVPALGNEERKITVAEVVREAIRVGHGQPDWVDATVEELFTFEVAYIGQSYGTEASSKAIDRLTHGHETVDKILSDTQDFAHNRAVAFITIDQRMTSINAHMNTGPDGADVEAAVKLMAERWSGILSDSPLSDTPLSETTVDAAEAALITAFKPEWNKELKDFTQKDAPGLVKKLKNEGYTHLHIHIDLKDSHAKVKGPLKGTPSSHHSWTFNLDTGAIENPGKGSWQRSNTPY